MLIQALPAPPPPRYVGGDGNVPVSRILLPGASDLVWSKEAFPQDTVGKERGKWGGKKRAEHGKHAPGQGEAVTL